MGSTWGLVVAVVLSCLGLAAAIAILARKTIRAGRVTGIIGAVLITIAVISDLSYSWVFGQFLAKVSETRLIYLLAGRTMASSVLAGIGLILLAYTISTSTQRILPESNEPDSST